MCITTLLKYVLCIVHIEVGVCKCWGDPHCLSFDKKMTHFQGACKYILTRDRCRNGLPLATPPTFQVIQKNWRGLLPSQNLVSWTKEIYIDVYNTVS